MGARIEWVEVRSFKLRVPRRALEQLPHQLEDEALELRLVAAENGTLLLGQEQNDSFLRFRLLEPDTAELTEVSISEDEQGAFFQSVLGALMVRYSGDLYARLIFDPTASGAGEPWAEVRIEAGRTAYPGLATHSAASNLAHAAGQGGSLEAEGEAPDEEDERPLTAEEEELARLLRQAESAWQEYQRLKRERQAS